MKDIAVLTLMNFPSCLCVAAAAYLAAKNIDGWGWFLLVAVLLVVTKAKVD